MEPKFQNTFIPKRPVATSAGNAAMPRKKSNVSFIGMIITLIFILTLAAAGGVFGYTKILESDISKSDQQLQVAIDNLEPELIAELATVDAQLNLAERMLSEHVAASRFFEHLEDITLQNTRFTEFSYTVDPGSGASIQMSGISPNYESVALQSDVFARDEFVSSSLFSDLAETEEGDISFSVSVNLNSRLTSYTN